MLLDDVDGDLRAVLLVVLRVALLDVLHLAAGDIVVSTRAAAVAALAEQVWKDETNPMTGFGIRVGGSDPIRSMIRIFL